MTKSTKQPSSLLHPLDKHIAQLQSCSSCPDMIGPVITCIGVTSTIMSVGQAPGIHEGKFQRPFSWTAGKTLFKWFNSIGVTEEQYRQNVYMAAVCRCFPGKNTKGGDRVPNKQEIKQCSRWLEAEYELLQPELIIPIGKLAIQQYLRFDKLTEVIGKQHSRSLQGRELDIIPLPHPSGVSTWFRTEPGKSLLQQALVLIRQHPAWVNTFGNYAA